MTDHLTPLEVCERLVAPLRTLAQICGYHATAGYIWRNGSANRQSDDLPSARVMRMLLAYSDAHALGLTPAHLILGATEPEVLAILATREQVIPQGVPSQASDETRLVA